MKESMDFSFYPKNHFLFDDSNQKVLLKLSGELNACIFFGSSFLKPKTYSIFYKDSENLMTKQIPKGVNGTMKATLPVFRIQKI